MTRIFSLLAIAFAFASADTIEASADRLFADENAGRTVLEGSVKIVKGKDILRGDRVTISFTKEREISRFESKGASSFSVTANDGAEYKGEADEIVYLPAEGVYTLKGNARVEDPINKRKIIGEQITFNEITRIARVSGKESAPVRMIFEIKDRNETKP
ncbi:MAG: lipopolysaccharide transport periplasmic protein LptA [Helicobacteraceae bacterium]|jgi:lipopolysaccharide export system protein LptA|nr:lipopolysaccharide transport periplasmic protein LptA [Helicobacteraceae bacterium]